MPLIFLKYCKKVLSHTIKLLRIELQHCRKLSTYFNLPMAGAVEKSRKKSSSSYFQISMVCYSTEAYTVAKPTTFATAFYDLTL